MDFWQNCYKATRNANPSWPVFPHCCWTLSHVTGLSDVRCRLPTATLRLPSPTAFSEFLCPTPYLRSLPTSGRIEISSPNPLSGFGPKQRNCLLGGPPQDNALSMVFRILWIYYCILTFDSAGFSSCVNHVIARPTCVYKWKHVTWVTTVTTGIKVVVKLYIHGPQHIRWVLYGQSSSRSFESRYSQLRRLTARCPVLQRPTVTPCREAEEAKMYGTENNSVVWSREGEEFMGQYGSLVFVSLRLSHTYTSYDPVGKMNNTIAWSGTKCDTMFWG